MKKNSKIYIAGHTGLVGSTLLKKLIEEKYINVITFSHKELDLRNQKETDTMFKLYKPSYIFLAAARVGGIHANNTQSGEYFYDNIMIQNNVINSAHKYGVKKLIFIGSASVYPRNCSQPIKEEYLLSASLESTNSAFGIAKIAGIEMCKAYRKQWGDNFISIIPCNIYGPGDNFSLTDSHVLPAFIRKFHEAKINNIPQVEAWGDGTPKREFLFIEDFIEALILLMKKYNEPSHINVGSSYDIPIKFLAKMIKDIIGYTGEIVWNLEYPMGAPQKLLDSSKIKDLGWEPEISLEEGIKTTYKWFVENYKNIRK